MVEEKIQSLANEAINLIGDRWKILIIQNLMDGTKRFGELKRDVGEITQKVLTSNLRLLEEKGLIVREVYAQIPPRVEYTLTSLGESLEPIINSILEWTDEYLKKIQVEFAKI